MGKGFLKSIAKGIKAPIQFVGKIHRETFRIIDQGLEKANAAIEKTGFNKILGGSSVGVSTSSGSSGGSNVYIKLAGSSNSVGVGLSNSGDASLFVNNNVAVPLTTPKANFITTENVAVEYSDNNTIKNQTDTVSNALAERDQLLREIYGPGYIPESSLATIGVIAISSATNQLLHDTWDTANTIANVNLNNQVIIHSMNEIERADAWNRNQEIYGNVSNAVSNVCANPAIIPEYYTNRFEESSNIFSSSLESGNLIGAGNAMGQTIYDSYIIASTVTGATALTAQAITATNNFVSTNNFRSPLVFQFEGARLNSGLPLDQVKFRKSISKKRDTKNPVADNTAHEPIEYTQLNEQSDIITYAQGNSVSNEFKIEKIAQNTELGLFHQYNRNIDLTIRNPNAVAIQMGWGELSPRQTHLLDQLSKSGKAITIKKNHLSMHEYLENFSDELYDKLKLYRNKTFHENTELLRDFKEKKKLDVRNNFSAIYEKIIQFVAVVSE